MFPDKRTLKNALRAEAKRLGFASFGVTGADADWSGPLGQWLESGAAGTAKATSGMTFQRPGRTSAAQVSAERFSRNWTSSRSG